jgi:MFS family permease
MAAAVVSLLDRQIMLLLVEPIRADLGLSDTQISLLQGLAFALFYTTAAIPIGHLVDRVSRRNLIVAGMVLWSGATMLCGLASTFTLLFLGRILVGFGEACLNPSAFSLMCDYFAPNQRGRAYGLFASAGSIGTGISLLLGAAVFAAMGATTLLVLPLFGALAAWKVVFILAGIIGIVMALLLFAVPEPPRMEAIIRTGAEFPGALAYIRSHKLLIGGFMASFALMSLAHYACLSWLSAYYMRTFQRTVPQAGLIAILILPCGGIIGSILGGLTGDRIKRQGTRGGRLNVALWSNILLLPALFGWLLTDWMPLSIFFGWMFMALAVAGLTAGPLALNELLPNELRGRMAAIYMLIIGLLGLALGPSAVALFTDYLFADDLSLRYSMLLVAVPTTILAIALLASLLTRYSRAEAANALALNPNRT